MVIDADADRKNKDLKRQGALVREKKARLWEKTIVTAFRDMQWKNKGDQMVCPPSNLEFGGNIERAFGDSNALIDKKFYLFEMKSTALRVVDEWEGGEKFAFSSLRKKAEKTFSGQVGGSLSMLHQSLKFHHFLYWSEWGSGFDLGFWPGALGFSPYLKEITELKLLESNSHLGEMMSLSTLAISVDASNYRAVKSAFVSRIFSGDVALVTADRSGAKLEHVSYELGATPREMSDYLEWLLEEQPEKDLPINALLASEDGVVCRHASHVSDLIMLLEAILDATPKSKPSVKARFEKVDDSFGKIKPLAEAEFLAKLAPSVERDYGLKR